MLTSVPKSLSDNATLAAFSWAAAGVPVAPFDPTKGKGKSCWNLVGYQAVTTNRAQLSAWRNQVGEFAALATSPGQFGCVVLDVDTAPLFPKQWRKYLDDPSVPFIATRPTESKRRGHYWFRLPGTPASPASALATLGNPAFEWGEVRCHGGGIVLPPYGDRVVVRSGVPPVLPKELAEALERHVFQAGAGEVVSVRQFVDRHQDNRRPQKLNGQLGLHQKLLNRGRSPHDAMREALRVGLGEARVGYVPATNVIDALRDCWDRDPGEFDRLVLWAVGVAERSDPAVLQLVSDRAPGTDSREYGCLVPPVRYAGTARETNGSTTH